MLNPGFRDIVGLAAIYFAAHSLILVTGNTLFWDGHWMSLAYRSGNLLDAFREAGYPIFGYLHRATLSVSPFAGRLASFVLHFLSGILLLRILSSLSQLSRQERFFVVCLFLVLPVNFARISIVNLQYAVCLCMFMFGWWAWCRYEVVGGLWRRLLALTAFFFSFFTQSLLVFFLWPFLMAWRASKLGLIKFAILRIDFLLAPFIFFTLNRIFLLPHGRYETYNQIIFGDLIFSGPPALVWSAFTFLDTNLLILLIAIPFSVAVLRLSFSAVGQNGSPESQKLTSWLITAIGLAITATAVLPYLMVGKLPLFQGWTSRHQLLMPLGIAVTVLGLLRLAQARPSAVYPFIVAICIATTSTGYWQYVVDMIKQDAFVVEVSAEENVRNGKYFPVVDNTWYLDAFRRQYNPTEYMGLLNRAFDDTRERFAMVRNYAQFNPRTDEQFAALLDKSNKITKENRNRIDAESLDCEIVVDQGSVELSMKLQILLTLKKLTDIDSYRSGIRSILDVHCRPIP